MDNIQRELDFLEMLVLLNVNIENTEDYDLLLKLVPLIRDEGTDEQQAQFASILSEFDDIKPSAPSKEILISTAKAMNKMDYPELDLHYVTNEASIISHIEKHLGVTLTPEKGTPVNYTNDRIHASMASEGLDTHARWRELVKFEELPIYKCIQLETLANSRYEKNKARKNSY